jgi:hypothetical protein
MNFPERPLSLYRPFTPLLWKGCIICSMKVLLVLILFVRLCEFLARGDFTDNEEKATLALDSGFNEKEGKELLDKATASTNTDYLSAEKALVLAPQAVESVLSANLTNSDFVARAIARSVLDMRRSDSTNTRALKIMEHAEEDARYTVVGRPRPGVTAGMLVVSLGSTPAEFLALRLLKEAQWQDNFQDWKAKSVLRYLRRARNPDAAELLIRFAIETKRNDLRSEAVEALQEIERPQLQRKLRAQRERLRSLGKVMPEELSALLND